MGHIKKLNLIVAHTDIVNVLSELIELECIEPTEPVLALDPPELTDLLKREEMELGNYDANYESITLLTTQYTYFLSGWLPAESEPKLVTTLARFMCSWEIISPVSHDADDAPIILKYPMFFGKMRSGGRRIFAPLSKSFSS